MFDSIPSQVSRVDPEGSFGEWFHEAPGGQSDPHHHGLHVSHHTGTGLLRHPGGRRRLYRLRSGRWGASASDLLLLLNEQLKLFWENWKCLKQQRFVFMLISVKWMCCLFVMCLWQRSSVQENTSHDVCYYFMALCRTHTHKKHKMMSLFTQTPYSVYCLEHKWEFK